MRARAGGRRLALRRLGRVSEHQRLSQAWGLASLQMANTHYTQAVLHFLADGRGGVCRRSMLMLELAIELHAGGYGLDELAAVWPRRRSDTAPMTPRAIKAA